MKLLNKKQKNNKGFSLVELIVVIAIMVVLVAVLAPVFTRYIESSRRATDVQNTNSIAEGVLSDVADGKTYEGRTEAKSGVPTVIKDDIKSKGDKVGKNQSFYFVYDKNTNKCAVYVGEDTKYDLTQEGSETDDTGAAGYKKQ